MLNVKRILLVGVLAHMLAGCVTSPERMTDDQRASYLIEADAKADKLLAEGKKDEAVAVLNDAASVDPARSDPWLRMARIHFDAEQYGAAISAAEEVLQRDPSDLTAKSVRAVSGLRVATDALRNLRDDTEAAGTTRADAENLAKVLRETLGEDVLIPPVDQERLRKQRLAEEKAAARAEARRKAKARQAWLARKKRLQDAAEQKAAESAGSAASGVDGDPFNILR